MLHPSEGHPALASRSRQMKQSTLELDAAGLVPADRIAFDIGWDHAAHGLVPPLSVLHAAAPIYQGWQAAKALFGPRTRTSRRASRQWLALRLRAWQEGVFFDNELVTANYLGQIQADTCPVMRTPLTGVAGSPDESIVTRINDKAGYIAGNLVTLSSRAVQARATTDISQAVRRARQAELVGEPVSGLDAAAWWRLAALASFGQRLPFAEACALPMAMLPPNRVRVVNAAQGLQALITRIFMSPGWSTRCRDLAHMLPEHTWRLDFNLFVGAMAPRVLEAPTDLTRRRLALEDAWLQDRVQRRWQHLLLSVGEAGIQNMLDRALESQPPGQRLWQHCPAPATEPVCPPSTRLLPVARRRGVLLSRAAAAAGRPGPRGTAQTPAAQATHG